MSFLNFREILGLLLYLIGVGGHFPIFGFSECKNMNYVVFLKEMEEILIGMSGIYSFGKRLFRSYLYIYITLLFLCL